MAFILLDNQAESGTLFLRLQKRTPKLNLRISTGIRVDVAAWNKAQTSARALDKYSHSEKGKDVIAMTSAIDEAVNNLLAEGRLHSNDDKNLIVEAINWIVNAEAKRMEQEQREREMMEHQAQEKVIIRFYDAFMDGIKAGDVKHHNGETYRRNTIIGWESFGKHLRAYCKPYTTFDDVNKKFADGFVAYLEKEGMMQHTINKYVVNFRKLCRLAAKTDGVNGSINKNEQSLHVWSERTVHNDSARAEIYLTDEELDAIYNYPLEGKEDEARDLFMLGCISCQRFSDYGILTRDSFSTTDKGTTIIKVKQTKTGCYVEIPVKDKRVNEICAKYDYQFPQISSRRMNDFIQAIAMKAAGVCESLNEKFTTILTMQEMQKEQHYAILKKMADRGEKMNKEQARTFRIMDDYAKRHNGQPLYERNADGDVLKYKYELVTTHTARRTGVTNLYKTGLLDTRDMMAISGHQTERVFEHYVRMTASEKADRIMAKWNAADEAKEAEETITISKAEYARLMAMLNNK